MKSLLAALWLIGAAPLHGATILPVVQRYDWNFTLSRVASTTQTVGDATIRFFTSNKLVTNEFIKIKLFAFNATTPFYSVNMTGGANGVDVIGLLFQKTNLYTNLPGLKGRMELSMFINGTVDLETLTISARDGVSEYSAKINPNVTLVPEPGVALMIAIAGGFAFRRRRCPWR
jgi:hypothetical protein